MLNAEKKRHQASIPSTQFAFMRANFNTFSTPKTILPTPIGFRNFGFHIPISLGYCQSRQGAKAAQLTGQGALDQP
jgi:hypothetical protein